MRKNARAFYRAFSWVPGGFISYFAVKALPNPYILELLKGEGFGGDCSSLPELLLCQAAGITWWDVQRPSGLDGSSRYSAIR